MTKYLTYESFRRYSLTLMAIWFPVIAYDMLIVKKDYWGIFFVIMSLLYCYEISKEIKW